MTHKTNKKDKFEASYSRKDSKKILEVFHSFNVSKAKTDNKYFEQVFPHPKQDRLLILIIISLATFDNNLHDYCSMEKENE